MNQKEDSKETDSSTPEASPAPSARQHSDSETIDSVAQNTPSSESHPFLEIPTIPTQRSSSWSNSSPKKLILGGSQNRPFSAETKIAIFKEEDKTPEPTSKSLHSILSFFGELKQKPSVQNQLFPTLQALCDNKPMARENFLTYTEQLMLIDTDSLNKVLTETTKKISGKSFAKKLEVFLNGDLNKVTNALIDALYRRTDEGDIQERKSKISRNIIAISLLEKILFPERMFRFCRELAFVEFTLPEKTQLGTMLQKIDSTFDIDDWISQWETGMPTFQGIVKFEDNVEQDNNHKSCCC